MKRKRNRSPQYPVETLLTRLLPGLPRPPARGELWESVEPGRLKRGRQVVVLEVAGQDVFTQTHLAADGSEPKGVSTGRKRLDVFLDRRVGYKYIGPAPAEYNLTPKLLF